jgi:hypothetical protein
MKARYRVSYAFTGLSDFGLIAFLQVLIICMTDNPAFTSLPVTLADLQALLTTFQNAVNAMGQSSSPQLTAERDEAREALLDAVRKIGAYVQSVALNSLSMLLSSGFSNVSAPSGQTPLPAPTILSLTNYVSTELLLRLTPIVNARAYETQVSTDNSQTWVSGGISSQARQIVLANLTPGTTYQVQSRAIGGAPGKVRGASRPRSWRHKMTGSSHCD